MAAPGHPYTKGLMACRPKLPGPGRPLDRQARLPAIPGHVPGLGQLPSGCTFRDRCPQAMPVCADKIPGFFEAGPEHQVRCWLLAGRERAE